MMDIRRDDAFAGLALGAFDLLGALLPLLFEYFDGVVEGLGFGQRIPAINETGAGDFTQLGDLFRGSFHCNRSLLSAAPDGQHVVLAYRLLFSTSRRDYRITPNGTGRAPACHRAGQQTRANPRPAPASGVL